MSPRKGCNLLNFIFTDFCSPWHGRSNLGSSSIVYEILWVESLRSRMRNPRRTRTQILKINAYGFNGPHWTQDGNPIHFIMSFINSIVMYSTRELVDVSQLNRAPKFLSSKSWMVFNILPQDRNRFHND